MKLTILLPLLTSSPTIPLNIQATRLVAIHRSKILVLLADFSDRSSKNVSLLLSYLLPASFHRAFPEGGCEVNLLNQMSVLEVSQTHSIQKILQTSRWHICIMRLWTCYSIPNLEYEWQTNMVKSPHSLPVHSKIQHHCALSPSHHHKSSCSIMNW